MQKFFSLKLLCVGLITIPLNLAATNFQSIAQTTSQSQRKPNASNKVEQFQVVGNEPFWSIDISQKGIVYSWVGNGIKKQTFPYVNPQAAEGRTLDVVRVYRLRGRADNLLIIQKANGFCSDTMSDHKYPYTATLILGKTVRTGCAEKK